MRDLILWRVKRCLAGERVPNCRQVSPTVVDYEMPSEWDPRGGTVIRVIRSPIVRYHKVDQRRTPVSWVRGWIFKCGDMVESFPDEAR